MNDWIMERLGERRVFNRRLGLGLAAAAVLYIAAVIVFIIVY